MIDVRRGNVLLHCHFDGCVRHSTIEELSREQGIELTAPIGQLLRVDPINPSLVALIGAMAPINAVTQTPEALYRVSYELVEDWKSQGIVHGEARFVPVGHTQKGMTINEVINSVACGLRDGSAKTGVSYSLIAGAYQGGDAADTWKVVEAAALNDAVRGIDLMGPPDNSMLSHADAFQSAREAGLKVTVHAGWQHDDYATVSISQAIDVLGADRISQPIQAFKDPKVAARLIESKIPLEFAPITNKVDGACPITKDLPIERFRRAGVPVSVSADAYAVTGATMKDEYELMRDTFGWTPEVWRKTQLDALNAAFIGDDEKRLVRQQIEEN